MVKGARNDIMDKVRIFILLEKNVFMVENSTFILRILDTPYFIPQALIIFNIIYYFYVQILMIIIN
jgi:hypothetical protein